VYVFAPQLFAVVSDVAHVAPPANVPPHVDVLNAKCFDDSLMKKISKTM